MKEQNHGVQSVTITLNREVLVCRDLRHPLIREQIKEVGSIGIRMTKTS
jgi:hypothetical protein